jgi:DNA-directed RNA polymerase specialized sigma24 family protein
MGLAKNSNQLVNEKIQEIAIKLYENTITDRQKNEQATLVYPKLKYYIWSICKNEDDTEEALQWSFKKIFNNLEKFDPGRAKFTTWVYSIARNETLFYLYKKSKDPLIAVDCLYDPRLTNIGEDINGIEGEIDALYNITICEIHKIEDPTLKGIAIDKMIKNERVKTIALRYDINENTIKTKLRKIRSDIRSKIIKENPGFEEILNHLFKS